MRWAGTLLGAPTIVMALMKPVGLLAALYLIILGEARFVVLSAALLLGGILLTFLVDGLRVVLKRSVTAPGLAPALLRGLLPGLLLTVFAIAVFALSGARLMDWPQWSVSYLAATGAVSLRAWRAPIDEATLRRIEAYAIQVSYALLTLAAGWLDLTVWQAFPLALLPLALPTTLGTMLALADPAALRDVQV